MTPTVLTSKINLSITESHQNSLQSSGHRDVARQKMKRKEEGNLFSEIVTHNINDSKPAAIIFFKTIKIYFFFHRKEQNIKQT